MFKKWLWLNKNDLKNIFRYIFGINSPSLIAMHGVDYRKKCIKLVIEKSRKS